MRCPRCGADLPEGARFCPSCGTPVALADPQEERKTVSVLFVDIVGSTAHADGADPEDVRDRNKRYYEEVSARIERHGGAVEKYVGDAVMAVFGAPKARSDDPERAVRAAKSILEGIDALNAKDPALALAVRISVCTGEAMVTLDGAPIDALATGDVVNTAARLQNAAPVGGVLVDRETWRATHDTFAFEPVPPIEAKGKAAKVEAWIVGEALRAPASRPTSQTPLIGRDRELSLIDALWERATSSARPHLVTIIGPAGMGKSRLAREITARIAATPDATSLWGRSLPYEERTAYRAAGEIVRRAAGIYENESVETARAKVEQLVAGLFPPEGAAEATRYLSLLLGLGLDEPPDESVHLFFAMRRLIEHLSERGPLLLVFEDVHWADDALLDLIDYLVTHVHGHRVLFLALARPEFLETRPTWGAGLVASTTLALEPLTSGEAASIVATLLQDCPSATVANVVTTSEGNPLFIEELVAAVADDPALEQLPATVRAAIAARVDALPEHARAALLTASVIGKTFWRGVLDRIGAIEDVDEALDALESRGLILRRLESRVAGEVEYTFKHVLVRDTAYGTLPKATRRARHAAIAEILEASTSEPRELAWILAHHWREADQPGRAIPYLLSAAETARDALALEETFGLYGRAMDLAPTPAERTRIQLQRGLALAALEDFPRADAELAEVIPHLEEGRDLIMALLGRARSTFWTEQTDETIALAARAVELATTHGLADLEGPTLGRLADTHAMRGGEGDLEKALAMGDRALEVWHPGTHVTELAEHYHLQSNTYYWAGRFEGALSLAEHAAEAGGLDAHSAEALLRGSGMEGMILAGMGRYEEAIAASEASIAIARRLGRSDSVVMNYSTMPLREIFAADEAGARSEILVDRLQPSSFNMPRINARADLIGARLLQGDLGWVEGFWPGAWQEAVESAAWQHWLVSGRLAAYRAELELRLGRLEDAVTWAERAIDFARVGHRAKYETVALTWLGRALTASGQVGSAIEQLYAAVAGADRLGTPLLRWQARAALAEALDLRPGEGGPDGVRAEAGAIIREVVASLAPERAATYLEAPQVAQVLARTG